MGCPAVPVWFSGSMLWWLLTSGQTVATVFNQNTVASFRSSYCDGREMQPL